MNEALNNTNRPLTDQHLYCGVAFFSVTSFPACRNLRAPQSQLQQDVRCPGGCPLHRLLTSSMQLCSPSPSSVWRHVKPRASCTALLSSASRSAAPATPLGRKSSRAQVEAWGRRTTDMPASWKADSRRWKCDVKIYHEDRKKHMKY